MFAFSTTVGAACTRQMVTFADLADRLKLDLHELMRQCNAKAPPSKAMVKGLARELKIGESFLEKAGLPRSLWMKRISYPQFATSV